MNDAPLTIQLFGPLRVLLAGAPMPRVRTRSVEWLLALLTLRHDREVERAWLSGTLWPESEESQAFQNLRTALVSLRKALGPESARILSPTRDMLRLDLDGAEVDVVRFDAGIRAGGDDSLRGAVEAHTGPLLEGCYAEWALVERERRAHQCLEALVTLAERAQSRGEHGEAIRFLHRAEALDPLRDTTARSLMTSLETTGDPAAAIEVYHRLRHRLHSELSAEPDEATTRQFREIRIRSRSRAEQKSEASGPPDRSAPAHPSFLPVAPVARPPHPLTRMIGREQEVAAVRQRLTQSRLVTLIGAGGIGKTRLAMEVAALAEEEFEGGVAWVELAPLAEDALLLPTLAAALGIRQEGASDAETLRSQVVTRLSGGATLLALDNCEHLLDAATAVVQQLLSRCPDLRVLATSRQRFGLTGEVTWRVPSLPSPDPESLTREGHNIAETVLAYPAIQLFVERAAMARSGFRLTDPEDGLEIARICHRLDGIPLAIELAAARVSTLSVEQIASRLGDRFRLLTGGSRDALTRHQTLRALIDWSYDLLTAEERALLCRLSVFSGGWTLEAAEAVCAGDLIEEWETLELLTSLIDKCLVVAEAAGVSVRYRLLETVREYGREKLGESGEEEVVRARHAEHYLVLAEQAHPFLEKPELVWLDRLETEHDNLRAALNYYGTQEEQVEKTVRLVAALAPFWGTRGHFYAQRTWLLKLASRPTAPSSARSELLSSAAWLAVHDKDFAGAKQMMTERLEIVRQLGEQGEIARALHGLAGLISDPNNAGSEYDCLAARALAEESLAIVRELGDRQGMAYTLYLLGHLAREVGDNDEARARWLECSALDQELGNKGGYVLRALGELTRDSGDYAAARHFFGRYMTERYEIGDRWGVAWGLEGFCTLALAEGEEERAARLLGASLALGESIRPLSEEERTRYEALRNAVRDALGESALGAAEAEGRAMTLEQAIEYALEQQANQAAQGQGSSRQEARPALASSPASLSLPSALPSPLTPLIGREQETQEIAEALSRSRLVTLVGAGGVGKTRLAMQVAREHAAEVGQEVAFVELASLSDPFLLPTFVATALGIREEATPEQALMGWLSTHKVLLVLDNCEHLVVAAASLVQALLERCPDLRILATSRQRLGLTGEVAWRVPSLSFPDPAVIADCRLSPGDESIQNPNSKIQNALMQYPAVQLFVERAAMARPGFRLTDPEDGLEIARICHRLDGIPLAIELAAARVGVLSVGQIASRLGDRFRLLTGGSRGALTRHQTLRALIDWSYDLLTEEEQVLLCLLAVFAGGWTLEAAEAICNDERGMINDESKTGSDIHHSSLIIHHSAVLDLLASLVDKSLVLSEEGEAGSRYRMLETVREYAGEKLRESGTERVTRDQHLAYFLERTRASTQALAGSDPEPALGFLDMELDNIRAALAWAQTHAPTSEFYLQLATALWPFWEMRGYLTEGRTHLRTALSLPDSSDSPIRSQALIGATRLAILQSDVDEALTFGQECLEQFRGQEDARGMAEALLWLGEVYLVRQDFDRGVLLLTEALNYSRQSAWRPGTILATTRLGLVHLERREMSQARWFLEEGLALAEALGNPRLLAIAHQNLGVLETREGNSARARTLLEKGLEIRFRLGDRMGIAFALGALGNLEQYGDRARAITYWQEEMAIYRELGNAAEMAHALHRMGNLHYEQRDYESARQVYAEALEMSMSLQDEVPFIYISMNLGSALFHLGDPVRAMELHREALALYLKPRNEEGIVWSLERIGVVEAMHGDAQKAARLLGAASLMRERLGLPMAPLDKADWEEAVSAVRAAQGDDAFDAAWQEGCTMSLGQAIEYALEERKD